MVSVVIPVHNGADTIGRALESVSIQNVPLEVIIVDDKSDDDLKGALAPFTCSMNIKYISNAVNIGAAASRNKGVLAASGDYIAFLDCDDWWEADKLKRQLHMIRKTGTIMCSTGRRLICPGKALDNKVIPVKTKITYRDMLGSNLINCSSVLIRKDAALEFPMEHEECHEDYLTWLKILKKYKVCCALSGPYLNYSLTNTGKSGSKLNSAAMTYKVYRHLGMSIPGSSISFLRYTINGIKKYFF